MKQLTIINPRCIGDGDKVRDYICNLGFQITDYLSTVLKIDEVTL